MSKKTAKTPSASLSKIAQIYARDHGVQVLIGGTDRMVYADLAARTIHISGMSYLLEGNWEMKEVFDGLLDHEVVHIREETLWPDGDRMSDILDPIQKERRGTFAAILNAFEDARITRRGGEDAPGIACNLRAMGTYALAALKREILPRMPIDIRRRGELAARVIGGMSLLGAPIVWDLKSEWSELSDFAWPYVERSWSAESPRDILAITEEFMVAAERFGIEDLVDPEDAAPEPLTSLASSLLADGVTSPIRAGDPNVVWHLADPDAAARDRVIVVPPAAKMKYLAVARAAKRSAKSLARKISMKFLGQVPTNTYDLDSGELDEDMLIDLAMFDERKVFFDEGTRVDRSSAWIILVDQSTSMGLADVEGTPSHASVAATMILGEAVSRMGGALEVWGFTHDDLFKRSAYSEPNLYTRCGNRTMFAYKQWGDPWRKARRRIPMINASRENDDSDAVFFAIDRFASRRERHKNLVVISDGNPIHEGVRNRIRANPSLDIKKARDEACDFARRQLADALRIARRRGIRDIAFGLKTNHVIDLYSHAIEIDNLDDLPSAMLRVAKAITK